MTTEFILRPDAPNVRDNAVAFIRALNPKYKWAVVVKRYQKQRSLDQNALFHKWVHVIAVARGCENHDIKEALKAEFLPPRLVALGDKLVEVRRSTAALNVAEMAEFMERVEWWAGSEGIRLPTKEDVLREHAA